jgi:hypothetical protein
MAYKAYKSGKSSYYKKPAVAAPQKLPRQVRNWSDYQRAIFADIESGIGNTQVDALAGSGKTSSIVEGSYYVPRGKTTLMCAFNKAIQVELASRMRDDISVLTLHSLGFRASRNAFQNIKVDNDKVDGYIRAEIGDEKETYELRDNLKKAISLSKGYLADTSEEIDVIMDKHGVDTCDASRPAFIDTVIRLMAACKNDTARMDFDDMIWFPNTYNLRLDKHDYVFIDEAQDLNKAQIELAMNSKTENGRVISVGDENQCVDISTIVQTPEGDTIVGNLRVGSKILSYRNGRNEYQTVTNVWDSKETTGCKIVTESGKTLTMTHYHQLWAKQDQASTSLSFIVHFVEHNFEGSVVYTYLKLGETPVTNCFQNNKEGLEFAIGLADYYNFPIKRTLKGMDYLQARELQIGMSVAVNNGIDFVLEKIVSIEQVSGKFVDIEVTDAANFYGNGILSHNCIYAFRGADEHAIQNIVDRCASKRLPLSVTYRCAKSIVRLAQEFVPDLQAFEGAEEGLVDSISTSKLEGMVKPGDFVLSRINAPLIRWCMTFLKAGIPANIQGRDVGKSLEYMIKKSKASDIMGFLNWLQVWRDNEIIRLSALRRDFSVVDDKYECLLALCEGASTLGDVKDNIRKLFSDGDDSTRVILSSTHKAKGLERDRVFLLKNTYRPSKGQEERNLYYVAMTRARKSLYLVDGI